MAFDITIFVSKDGNDGNGGLTYDDAKLTLNGAKAILVAGENQVLVGIGEYTEVCDWNSAAMFVSLIGDYDGAIFSTAAGEVKITSSSDFVCTYIREFTRMKIKLTSSYDCFINRCHDSKHDMVWNFIEMETYTSFSYIHTSYLPKNPTITFNDCSLVSGRLRGCMSEMSFKPIYYFNRFDSITNNIILEYMDDLKQSIWDDCTISFGYGFIARASACKMIVKDSTFKMKEGAATIFRAGILLDTQTSGPGYVLFKDCNILDTTSTALDLNASEYINWRFDDEWRIQYSYVTVSVQYYTQKDLSNILMDNINSNGKKDLLFPGGPILDGDTDTHNDDDVLYFHYKLSSGYNAPNIIKLGGLAVSTEYTVTFDYQKAADSTDTIYDTRFGILEAYQRISLDLYTTPANALDYADYLSVDHTYNTWYDGKTLTFTTSADDNAEYFLAFYSLDDIVNFKITKPVIAAT